MNGWHEFVPTRVEANERKWANILDVLDIFWQKEEEAQEGKRMNTEKTEANVQQGINRWKLHSWSKFSCIFIFHQPSTYWHLISLNGWKFFCWGFGVVENKLNYLTTFRGIFFFVENADVLEILFFMRLNVNWTLLTTKMKSLLITK